MFLKSFANLTDRHLQAFISELKKIDKIRISEQELITNNLTESLYETLHEKLSRLLIAELHISRTNNLLKGGSSSERWDSFIELISDQRFWPSLQQRYPGLQSRIDVVLHNRCDAARSFAEHWAKDRQALAGILGKEAGLLQELQFGAGDSHDKGKTVIVLRCEAGSVIYKPRSLLIDHALTGFLNFLKTHDSRIDLRVPRVLTRDNYGWAEYIEHRYAKNQEHLRSFYRSTGQWISIFNMFGASDMHWQNLIAHDAYPVVIDCETLFTPFPPIKPSNLGQAHEQAVQWLQDSVLGIGLLPQRSTGLGWRGIDNSAIGTLGEEQPLIEIPQIINAGTDEAYIGLASVPLSHAQNHPSEKPALIEYWPDILAGFDMVDNLLRRLDRQGLLRPSLDVFLPCNVRIVPRSTEAYSEIAYMFWHPAAFQDEMEADRLASDLFYKMGQSLPLAATDPTVIAAEVAELKTGDIPFFSVQVESGKISGTSEKQWLPKGNLIDGTLTRWRAMDMNAQRNIIRASLASAYINDNWHPDYTSYWPTSTSGTDMDQRRRILAENKMRTIIDSAIRANDGTVAWIAPVYAPTGWSVRPIDQDMYNGLGGIAVTMAAYLYEMRKGRANPIDGLEDLFSGVKRTLQLVEDRYRQQHKEPIKIRPIPPGGYLGLGGSIWTWLTLSNLGMADNGTERACSIASLIPESLQEYENCDILYGLAGALPPLIQLAETTSNKNYMTIAEGIGDRLVEGAVWSGRQAYWTHGARRNGLGGFSHGVTGIGWALAKLAEATGRERYGRLADGAFLFEENLFDDAEGNWIDMRAVEGRKSAVAWCHGAVGIGLAHLDLDPFAQRDVTRLQLRRAAAVTSLRGLGREPSACHGDASAWELLDAAIAHGEGPGHLTREALLDQWLTSLEEGMPDDNITAGSFSPGLFTGMAGIVYQLLKADRSSNLPSFLTLGKTTLN